MHHQNNTLTPSLRGISQSDAAAGDGSPIAIHVDGVYHSSLNAGLFSFNNIQRIEVISLQRRSHLVGASDPTDKSTPTPVN